MGVEGAETEEVVIDAQGGREPISFHNVFVKPKEQSDACIGYALARKRT